MCVCVSECTCVSVREGGRGILGLKQSRCDDVVTKPPESLGESKKYRILDFEAW